MSLPTGKTAQLPGDWKPQDDAKLSDGRATIFLPFPPSVNHYWRRVGNKTIISKEGREYRDDVCFRCRALRGMFAESPITVSIKAVFPDYRRRDLDNLFKSVLDSLAHAEVYADDSQIKCLSIKHSGTEKPGYISVRIEKTRSEP
jgi:crossover junction endodeoxyribonuclease RusA